MGSSSVRVPLYKRLYFQVIVSIALGILLGVFYPELGQKVKPLGDGFMKLVKMLIGPIVFCTVVVGIGKMGDMKEVGRVGMKSLLYFEIVSTIALILGMLVVNVAKPGVGLNMQVAQMGHNEAFMQQAKQLSKSNASHEPFFLKLIPTTGVQAFADNNILQILLFSILFGVALSNFGKKGKELVDILEQLSHIFFGMIGIIMRIAPLGAFGAMAFTVGRYGFSTLVTLASLIAWVYVTCIFFIVVVLGFISKVLLKFSIFDFIRYIKEEIFITYATASSESAMPRLMVKLENLGCAKPVVGLVIPTGYSFNLDGTSIYLAMATIFLAQAFNIPLTLLDQIYILGLLCITSKGAAGVSGSGFVVLLSTLSNFESIPVISAGLLLGIDKFMSDARSITNIIGNGIATVAIAQWEKAFNHRLARRVLRGETAQEADEPEVVADQNI
jgi:aerobic C4-dicarboxylate transport protein